jgi:hypothetical protein
MLTKMQEIAQHIEKGMTDSDMNVYNNNGGLITVSTYYDNITSSIVDHRDRFLRGRIDNLASGTDAEKNQANAMYAIMRTIRESIPSDSLDVLARFDLVQSKQAINGASGTNAKKFTDVLAAVRGAMLTTLELHKSSSLILFMQGLIDTLKWKRMTPQVYDTKFKSPLAYDSYMNEMKRELAGFDNLHRSRVFKDAFDQVVAQYSTDDYPLDAVRILKNMMQWFDIIGPKIQAVHNVPVNGQPADPTTSASSRFLSYDSFFYQLNDMDRSALERMAKNIDDLKKNMYDAEAGDQVHREVIDFYKTSVEVSMKKRQETVDYRQTVFYWIAVILIFWILQYSSNQFKWVSKGLPNAAPASSAPPAIKLKAKNDSTKIGINRI